jgi:hypothetical protein
VRALSFLTRCETCEITLAVLVAARAGRWVGGRIGVVGAKQLGTIETAHRGANGGGSIGTFRIPARFGSSRVAHTWESQPHRVSEAVFDWVVCARMRRLIKTASVSYLFGNLS